MLNADRLEFRFVEATVERDLAVVTIDDPTANTLMHHMVQQLEEAFVDVMMGPQIRTMALTSASSMCRCRARISCAARSLRFLEVCHPQAHRHQPRHNSAAGAATPSWSVTSDGLNHRGRDVQGQGARRACRGAARQHALFSVANHSGSVQHRARLQSTAPGSTRHGIDGRAQFSSLHICAEELRHAYQMFWVLSHDPSWAAAGIRNVTDQTMDELLEMTTSTHVLGAFNIPFHDPLDNIVFSFLIDRVGKYQRSM